ncbi:MAG: hypothetical protein DRH24_16820 [Deltaproteobacteria bacterium]|nr:MAG: hypothetical protein DRH24_16820 [Deltaproteobacteria bacterium]
MGKIKWFYRRYKAEIKISCIVAGASTAIGIFANAVLQQGSARIIIDITLGAIVILLLLGILFNLKILLTNFISKIPHKLVNDKETYLSKDKYWSRLKHFPEEKSRIAEVLVNKTLPKIIKQICKENADIHTLNIILDSGTTITPIFKELVCSGINLSESNVIYEIFTNNLAGIDEIYKIDPKACKLGDREFSLIGGKPLKTYRATTGRPTLDFLETIWAKQNGKINKGKIITLAILTANWFTCGMGFEKISITAKGEGHFDFKADVAKNSHYILLVSPLGKLLPIQSDQLLNDLVPEDPDLTYQSFVIPPEKASRTYLLTSKRPQTTLSPIAGTSLRLAYLKDNKIETNYILCEDCPLFDPEGDRYEVVVTELPHKYIRDNFQKVFHDKPL